MSGAPHFPGGIPLSTWFRSYLEAMAPAGGQGEAPPPAAAIVPPLPRVDNFSKLCKDFCAMGGKPFQGTESFFEAWNWL